MHGNITSDLSFCLAEEGFSLDELVLKLSELYELKALSEIVRLILQLVQEVLLITFYGDYIAERFREKLVAELGLTPARQAMLLTAGFLLICAILAGWSIYRCGAELVGRYLLLLTGAATAFFTGYLPSLFQPSMEVSRLALSRIKLLVFAVCVILAIHELLASDGWLRLPG
jgi:hypothetical protein